MSNHPKHGKHHQPTNPKQDSTQKESTNRHVYVEPGVQIDVVQDLKDQHKTERGEDTATHKKQIFWTKVGAALVLVYAVITFLMYLATKKAAEAADRAATTAKEALVRGQRPWVAPEREPEVSFSESNQKIQSIIMLAIKNYGPSPALHLGYHFNPAAGSADLRELSKSSCQLAELGVITSDNVTDSYGFFLVPNGTSRIFDKRDWSSGKPFNPIVGCIAYSDQFHNTPIQSPIHHTAFCYQSWSGPPEPKKAVAFISCNFFQTMD